MTTDLTLLDYNFVMDRTTFGNYNTLNHDFGSLSGNVDYVQDLISQGTSFNILYSDDGSITDRETEAEGLSSEEAVNHFLGNLSDFDGFTAVWDNRNNLTRVMLYENEREGWLGKILPKRGSEMIFEYVEE